MLATLQFANLALAFLLELCVLGALGYWGIHTGQGLIAQFGLALAAIIVAIVVWAIFGAPTAIWPLPGLWHLVVAVVFFGAAVLALFQTGQRRLALVFALLVVINHVLIYVWKQ